MTPETQAAGAAYLAALAKSDDLNAALSARRSSLEEAGTPFGEISDAIYGPPAMKPEGWQRDLALLAKEHTEAWRATMSAKVAFDQMLLTADGTPCAAAMAAAKWWADCTRGIGPRGSAGDAMVDMMIAWAGVNRPRGDAEASNRFEAALASDIDARLRQSLARGYDSIGNYDVDYGPSPELGVLASQFGVEGFPVKTHMWITTSRVKVSAGYRARPEIVYEADEIKPPPATGGE